MSDIVTPDAARNELHQLVRDIIRSKSNETLTAEGLLTLLNRKGPHKTTDPVHFMGLIASKLFRTSRGDRNASLVSFMNSHTLNQKVMDSFIDLYIRTHNEVAVSTHINSIMASVPAASLSNEQLTALKFLTLFSKTFQEMFPRPETSAFAA